MRIFLIATSVVIVAIYMTTPWVMAKGGDSAVSDALVGVWKGIRHYGHQLEGNLIIEFQHGRYRASIGGRSTDAQVTEEKIAFTFDPGGDRFHGRFKDRQGRIEGHWIEAPKVSNGTRYASPVTLMKTGPNQWRGAVKPLEDEMTHYLVVKPQDGILRPQLRNPDRNVGVFLQGVRLEIEGEAISYVGRFRGRGGEQVFGEGIYDAETNSFWMNFPTAGGTFDLEKVSDDPAGNIPRRPQGQAYRYHAPPELTDGWSTATLEEVGLSEALISVLIQDLVELPNDSLESFDVHGVLIARHGKLVLEEYFSGYHRDRPHDTRSASKSAASTLVGAAIHAGEPVSVSTPVYEAAYIGESDLDERKRQMTLRHLLTMAPGWDCDDSNGDSPGAEDNMQSQTNEPDWITYTLALPMVRDPGGQSVYCSAAAHMVGAVLERQTGKSLMVLFDDLIARPLQLGRYHMNLDPVGRPYSGGGIRWLPRDFMKLGQLMLDDGMWNGTRILPRGWAQEAGSPQVKIGDRDYGYLWWISTYPYKNRTVQAFFAGGNGGQIVMGIPELDLVIAFYGGNYSHAMSRYAQNTLIPKRILPLVDAD